MWLRSLRWLAIPMLLMGVALTAVTVSGDAPSTATSTTEAISPTPPSPPGPGVDVCDAEPECMVRAVIAASARIGPDAAIDQYHDLAEQYPQLKSGCHGYYESIGRTVTLTLGLTGFREARCQFGYLHGVLYAVGETYDSLDELMADLVEYCEGYVQDYSVNSPRGNCYHGVGHAAAEASPNDPTAALQACTKFPEDGWPNCADGVLMEYGDDHLKRVGFLHVDPSAPDDQATAVDPGTMRALCSDAPTFAQQVCYARLWKFVVLSDTIDLSGVNDLCATAPNRESKMGCHEGFGELVTHVSSRAVPWPPETAAAADQTARAVAQECSAMDLAASCLRGALLSMVSHLYAVDLDVSLIPDPCRYVAASLRASCAASTATAQELNWDKSNGTDPGI